MVEIYYSGLGAEDGILLNDLFKYDDLLNSIKKSAEKATAKVWESADQDENVKKIIE